MRVAVVADIHGNVRALRAVLDDIRELAPDAVVNLGDCVSGPLEAAETADLLISLAWQTIRGNHDRQVIDDNPDRMGLSDRAAHAELKNHHKAWLANLDPSGTIEDIALCHGSPDDDLTYLLERVEDDGRVRIATHDEIVKRLRGASAPVVLCGHSHMPRIVALDGGRVVVNPGSVGLPAYTDSTPVPHAMETGTPHARYAVLERRKAGETWKVSFRAVVYDWDAAAEHARQKGREDWARWLRTGYAG
jgi:putative phosphoesterase